MGLWNAIKQVVDRVLGKQTIETASGVKLAAAPEMVDAIELWSAMYQDCPPWKGATVQTIGLPAAIASEIARLVTIEMKSEISGSARAEYLNKQYRPVINDLRRYVEYGCAKGGLILKPYIDGRDIVVDYVQAGQFFPVAFDSKGDITDIIFAERKQSGDVTYTRLERHKMVGTVCEITNKAYRSANKNYLGTETHLNAVEEWAGLEPEVTIGPVDRLLVGCFRPALANTVDTTSPLGVSVYSRAVGLIEETDRQYSRLLWEFEGGELAIDADVTMFKKHARTGRLELPKGKERLFRVLNMDSSQSGVKPLEVFSPALRDNSLINGLNQLLQRIEDTCGLARGTFSDVQSEAKTATEIKVLKQRSYATVADNQKALQAALEQLVYAMDVWATLGRLAPAGTYDISYEWDDSVIVDTQSEQVIWMQEVAAGLLRPEQYLMWRYGVSEQDAKAMMPNAFDGGDG